MKINTEELTGTRWKHKMRGFTYSIITDTASLQCSSAEAFEQQFEDDHWVVYQSETTGHDWIRPRGEFLDGRFERLPPPEAT